jgi:hypothetical protein
MQPDDRGRIRRPRTEYCCGGTNAGRRKKHRGQANSKDGGDDFEILGYGHFTSPRLVTLLAGRGKSRSVVLPAKFAAFCTFVTH